VAQSYRASSLPFDASPPADMDRQDDLDYCHISRRMSAKL
jgi:hypothetical protein